MLNVECGDGGGDGCGRLVEQWCGSLLVAAVVGESVLAVVVGRAGGGRRAVGAAAGS